MQIQRETRSQTYQGPPRARRADVIPTDRVAAISSMPSTTGTKTNMMKTTDKPPDNTAVPTASQAGTRTAANH